MRLNDERVAEMEKSISENTELRRLKGEVQGLFADVLRLEKELASKSKTTIQLRQKLDLAHSKIDQHQNNEQSKAGAFEKSADEIFAQLERGMKGGQQRLAAPQKAPVQLDAQPIQVSYGASSPFDRPIFASKASLQQAEALQADLNKQRTANAQLEALYAAAASTSQQLEWCACNFYANFNQWSKWVINSYGFAYRERNHSIAECEELKVWMAKMNEQVHEKHSTAEASFVAEAEKQQRATFSHTKSDQAFIPSRIAHLLVRDLNRHAR